MATSGVYTFDPTRNEIIEGALGRIGVLSEGQSASPEQLSNAQFWLNVTVKSLQNDGVKLWTEKLVTQPIGGLTQSEVTGTDSLNYTCIKGHTSASGNRPITGSDWRTYWSQSGSAGSAWVTATAYSSRANFNLPARTISVQKAFYRETTTDVPMDLISYRSYLDIYNKSADSGRPLQLAVNELHPTKVAYVYPMPGATENTNQGVINMLTIVPIFDFTSGAETSDVPQQWFETILFGLAEKLSHVYGLDLNERSMHFKRFRESILLAKSGNRTLEHNNFVRGAY